MIIMVELLLLLLYRCFKRVGSRPSEASEVDARRAAWDVRVMNRRCVQVTQLPVKDLTHWSMIFVSVC